MAANFVLSVSHSVHDMFIGGFSLDSSCLRYIVMSCGLKTKTLSLRFCIELWRTLVIMFGDHCEGHNFHIRKYTSDGHFTGQREGKKYLSLYRKSQEMRQESDYPCVQ